MSDVMSITIGIIVLVAFLFIYFMPSYTAFLRKHHNRSAIVVFNLFLGWTFIGWVISLTWAMTKVESET
jgi:hypothetical protein